MISRAGIKKKFTNGLKSRFESIIGSRLERAWIYKPQVSVLNSCREKKNCLQ